jgi:predicted Zn-dependent protease
MAAVLDQYIQQKREEEGFTYLRGLMEKHTKERVIQEGYASLLLQRKRVPEAIAIYRRIAEDNPKDVSAQVQLAQYLDLNNQKDEATKLFETLIARTDLPADQNRALRVQLATRYILENRQADAIAQYQEVVKADPNDFVSVSTLAGLLTAANREQEAVPLYVSLLDKTAYPPQVRAQIRVRLGDLYAKQGNKTEAAGHYREALKLNPEDMDAKAGLKKVEGQ